MWPPTNTIEERADMISQHSSPKLKRYEPSAQHWQVNLNFNKSFTYHSFLTPRQNLRNSKHDILIEQHHNTQVNTKQNQTHNCKGHLLTRSVEHFCCVSVLAN